MKAKLIKEKDGKFHLWLNVGTKDADHISSNEPLVGEWGRNLLKYKLSLKNCQAIERGYDLDELAIDYIGESDKKHWHPIDHNDFVAFKDGFQKALELMKHRLVEETEWQVEVLMDICGDKVYAVPEPVLDEQGCLILKRVI